MVMPYGLRVQVDIESEFINYAKQSREVDGKRNCKSTISSKANHYYGGVIWRLSAPSCLMVVS